MLGLQTIASIFLEVTITYKTRVQTMLCWDNIKVKMARDRFYTSSRARALDHEPKQGIALFVS